MPTDKMFYSGIKIVKKTVLELSRANAVMKLFSFHHGDVPIIIFCFSEIPNIPI